MPKRIKLIVVAGARPNFVKIAPLVSAIKKHNNQADRESDIDYCLVHTGQHYDVKMSSLFFKELEIQEPHINLEVGSGSHAEQTAKVMIAFEPICINEKPDWVIVVGDVNSTMACTLVASKLCIKVAHVEAGLRSFDRTMPEEINRIVTDSLADLLLTPSADADENLKREGISPTKIRFVGNIMIDTLVANLNQARCSNLPDKLCIQPNGFAYVTLHRPSNVDDQNKLGVIMGELNSLARLMPVIFPVHPRTRNMLKLTGIPIRNEANLKLIEPIGYHDSLCLTEKARFILTDSGGLQEESTYLGTPCLTLRPNTERPITIEVGTNKLTRPDTLSEDIKKILQNVRCAGQIPQYWDGQTAERIIYSLQ